MALTQLYHLDTGHSPPCKGSCPATVYNSSSVLQLVDKLGAQISQICVAVLRMCLNDPQNIFTCQKAFKLNVLKYRPFTIIIQKSYFINYTE